MFVLGKFQNINWEQVEFDEGESYLVVSHILSEAEI